MNCELSKEYFMKYFDGEISDIEEAQFRQHLKSCKRCSEEFDCMNEIIESLETSGTVEPPEDFTSNVMKTVDAYELARKERSSKMLILLYNAATVVSIILLMVFVADIKHVNITNMIGSITGYFNSFSSVASAVFGVIGDLFNMVGGIIGTLLQVFVSIVKTYYYVFAILLALLIAIQRLYVIVAAKDGGKT